VKHSTAVANCFCSRSFPLSRYSHFTVDAPSPPSAIVASRFLAYHTVTQSAIGIILSSVRLSVTKCIVAVRVGVWD